MSDPCDNDTLTISWSLNGETINTAHLTVSSPQSFNITNELDEPASMLTLLGPVNISYAGVYTCNATLGSGASNTRSGTLTVQGMMLNTVLVIFYVVKILWISQKRCEPYKLFVLCIIIIFKMQNTTALWY